MNKFLNSHEVRVEREHGLGLPSPRKQLKSILIADLTTLPCKRG